MPSLLALLLAATPCPQELVAPPVAPLGPLAAQASAPGPEAAIDAPHPPQGDALPDPHGRLHHFADGDAHWVRGRSYKAVASPQGFVYTPYLGQHAARSWPLGLRLARVRSGGADIPLASEAAVHPAPGRFVLDRGPVDVRYDLALDAVEQSFVVEAGAYGDDLVVELALTTELEGRPAGAGFRFEGPEGGVAYGAAIAFDAAGRRTDVATTLDGTTLRLEVPPAFVRAARGAITIDPLVTSFTVNDNSTFGFLEPDVSYDQTTNRFVFVYEELFNTTDVDIFYTVTDSNGGFVDNGYVVLSAANNADPEIANLDVADQCLAVWSQETAQGGSWIMGRLFEVPTGTWGPVFPLTALSDPALHCTRPDVGGGSLADPGSRYMVVWSAEQSDGDVDANLRSVLSNGTLGTAFRVETTTGKIKDEVVVGASVGSDQATGFWPLVVREEDIATGDVVIKGLRVLPNGVNAAEPAATLYALPAGVDATDIDVSSALPLAGLSPTYLVAYDQDGPGDEDVMLLVCRDNQRENRIELAEIEHGPVERNQILPRLSTTREDFVVTYLEQRPGTLSTDPYLSVVDLIEERFLGVSEQRTRIGDGGPLFSGGAAPASRYDSGLATSRVNGIAWARFDPAASSWNVYGVRHSGFNPAIAGPQYCVGNPNSTGERGFLMVQGSNDTTSPKTLVALRLPPGQFGLFASATLPAYVTTVSNSSGVLCLGGAIGRFNAQIAQADGAGELSVVIDPTALPTPNGTEAAMVGTFRQFQLWHRDVQGGMATSNFTNAVSVFFR